MAVSLICLAHGQYFDYAIFILHRTSHKISRFNDNSHINSTRFYVYF